MKRLIDTNIKAFTLLELSISIFLILIIVSIFYLTLQILRTQTDSKINSKIEEIALLKQSLNEAFIQALEIKYIDENSTLVSKDSNNVYQFIFDDRYILKKFKEKVDTLYKGSYNFEYNKKDETSLISNIKLNLVLKSDTIKLKVTKKYSPSSLLNHKNICFEKY